MCSPSGPQIQAQHEPIDQKFAKISMFQHICIAAVIPFYTFRKIPPIFFRASGVRNLSSGLCEKHSGHLEGHLADHRNGDLVTQTHPTSFPNILWEPNR